MPERGAEGAAIAFLLAYATQAAVAFVLAQRLYPMSYEAGRLLRVAVAAVLAVLAARAIPPLSPLAGFLARGAVTVAVYAAVLWATGFLRATERAFLREILRKGSRAKAGPPPERSEA
jgi:hypothetical protein